MSVHLVVFTACSAVVLLLLLVGCLTAWRRARQLNRAPSLEALLDRLVTVDRLKIALVAGEIDTAGNDLVHEPEVESWQVWELLGGMEGLEALVANCDVLIALAYHVQRWYPEALPVAEQLRLNAREVRWHLERLKGAEYRGHLESAFPDYARRAAAIYFEMTRHVVALYEATQATGLAKVQAAL